MPVLLLIACLSDATGRLSFEERGDYFAALDRAAEADLRAEADALHERRRAAHEAREPTAYSQFADLLENPEWWAGKPVCVRGHANLIQAYDPGENDVGLDRVYEAWIVGQDSDRYPSVVVARSLPEGVPVGEEMVGGLEACGVFFKLLTYKARDGKSRYAPLILAGSIGYAEPERASPAQWALAAIAAAMGVSVAVRVARGLSRKPPRKAGPPPDFGDLGA